MADAVIRMHAYEPCILTTEEFEELEREVTARVLVDKTTPGDRILARMLIENRWRYHEAREINAARNGGRA